MQHTIRPPRKIDPRLVLGVLAVAILLVALALIIIPRWQGTVRPAAPAYWPTTGWQTALPEAQGIDSSKLADAMLAFREQNIPIHSLFIVRDGYAVADATFYPYDGQTIHDVASVTKSVMTTLIGIAIDQGQLSLDDKVLSFFPDREIANRDARKEAITVRHLITMSSGLQCVRDGMEGETVSTMHASPDFVQFALDLPMAAEPGSRFLYCSPAIHLLSPILEQATGMTALEFARQYLFEPLGITETKWERDPQGYYNGWGDLSLRTEDMAKIGLLFLHQGRWDGEQIVSRQWVEEATAVQMTTPDGSDDPYGYGWWLSDDPGMEGVFRAAGRLGQNIIVLPQWDMILTTTGGGFEVEEISEPLLASFADMENPVPANPEGVARLESAVAAVAQPPAARPVTPLPDVARAISGRTIVIEPNNIGLDSIAFDFDDSAEATIYLAGGGEPVIVAPVGLDGVFRFSTLPTDGGRLVGLRGEWIDPQTFVMEYNGVVSNDQVALQLYFEGDRVAVTASNAVGQPGVELEGRVQEP
jgi:CubicO group peptidase (beta-lactamase class C family)